jgi:hypothetical protein
MFLHNLKASKGEVHRSVAANGTGLIKMCPFCYLEVAYLVPPIINMVGKLFCRNFMCAELMLL